jgi:hypothetical protein
MMAGRGPATGANPNRKDLGKRRRRNVSESFEELPAEGYTGEFPALATLYITGGGRKRYLAATRNWYETWARSPMAALFTAVDWQRLAMLAPLVDEHHREPSIRVMTELRLQESQLGATVLDRQRMRVRVGPPADKPTEPELPKLSNPRRLRAV